MSTSCYTHEGLLPLPGSPVHRDAGEPGAALRALARLRWFSLDGRLAAGEDPARSQLLAAQAARLTAPRQRELLAAALGGLLLAAEEGPRISRVAPSRSALLRNEAAVRELARRVDSQRGALRPRPRPAGAAAQRRERDRRSRAAPARWRPSSRGWRAS